MYRFAIIGCGSIARLHAELIPAFGKLTAVCDIVEEKADAFARQHGAIAFYDADRLIASGLADIICICTPNGCHAEHCIKSLQAGMHVLSEAPLCLTKAGAWQIIETEKFCRRKLGVVNIVRQSPEVGKLREAIRLHTNGNVYQFRLNCTSKPGEESYHDWRSKAFPGGGSLYTDFSNYLDLLVFLFGEMETAEGSFSNIPGPVSRETEDEGQARVQMKNGIRGTFQWSLLHEEGASIAIEKLKKPVEIDRLESILSPSPEIYNRIYSDFIEMIGEDHHSETLFESARTVEAIEKIYKVLSLNPT
jgi:predicted dehydrogenase